MRGHIYTSDDSRKIAWGQVLITACVTAFFSLVVGVVLYHYTSKAPDLIYEVFPPSDFTKQATQISIYNARVENAGNKEAEDVQVYLELPSSCNIQDMKVEPSLKSITYSVPQPASSNAREIHFPRLNQGESSTFSILVDKGEAAQLKIEVRGKGVTGQAGRKGKPISVMYAILGLVSASERRMHEVFTSQKNLVDKELQLIRTQGKTTQEQLTEILLSNRFRLFFNPKIRGLSKTKIMRFDKDGVILEGRNNNESSWRIRSGFLELLDSDSRVHSRFYYSPSDKGFYHTNDPDTGSIRKHSIRDQYMLAE